MISTRNPKGSISISNNYFADLVAEVTRSCYGVAAMSDGGPVDSLRSFVLKSDFPDKGVRVTEDGNRLVIELHIMVGFGLNIRTIADSITHRVKEEVEHATGFKVARINLYVDDIISE